MSDIVIRTENLSKRYRIGQREPYYTLRDLMVNSLAAPLRRFSSRRATPNPRDVSPGFIWALKDIFLEVKRGEVVGIIGRNGAGKTTLLKVLSRITKPTEGRAEIVGRVGSLLEVGTGFHPELTGRENIFLNGAILGMKKGEIDRRFDEIVAFAEIEKFIDTPVKHYSSGMYVRLAFAVAAHLEPEILLVDEVLAVGDVAFQKKCLGRMGDVAKEGRTVLFVSHNMGAVSRLCQRALWIDDGQLFLQGLSSEVVSNYLTRQTSSEGRHSWEGGAANIGVTELRVFSICASNEAGEVTSTFDVRRAFSVTISYRVNRSLPYCRVGFLLSTVDGTSVFEAYDADDERYAGAREPGDYVAQCEIPGNLLNPGRYLVSINAGVPNVKNLAFIEGILPLNIEDTGAIGSYMHSKRNGIIRLKLRWKSERVHDATNPHTSETTGASSPPGDRSEDKL